MTASTDISTLIGVLSTRIRSDDAVRAQALAGQVRQLADRQLARALEGAAQRAVIRAGLPATAVVAVQQLDVTLRVGDGVATGDLAEGWAAAFEARLTPVLARTPPGDGGGPDDDRQTPVVWFPDPWAAEQRHLERRAAGWPDAWWAPDLAAGRPSDMQADDPLDAYAIVHRWIDRDLARAITLLTILAQTDVRHAALLDRSAATRLTRLLLRHLANPTAAPGHALPIPPPSPAAALRLHAALERFAFLGRALARASSPAQAAPWLAAALFAANPSLGQQAAAPLAEAIEEALQRWSARGAPNPTAPGPLPTPDCAPSAAGPTTDAQIDTRAATHPVHAGGLLLLLRPLIRLGLLPDANTLAPRLGDLALAALRRVLAPLPAGERAAAEERERPLLAVFAPECDWRAPIASILIREPDAAHHLLEALVDAIPAEVAFAPGAERRVFGPTGAAYSTEPTRRLARLLLRPGTLTVTPWDAELAWPLASIDLALRRAGWDQDPGWVPWLGRSLRLRYGDAS